jgi:hypothetical protein
VFLLACRRFLKDGAVALTAGDKFGGREGIRTLDPRIANAVLSQLSYSPLSLSLSGYNLIYRME